MNDSDLIFRALADPSRRKLLDALNASDAQTLTELCEHLDMTRQAVTQHLTSSRMRTWSRRIFERPRLKALRDLKKRLEGS